MKEELPVTTNKSEKPGRLKKIVKATILAGTLLLTDKESTEDSSRQAETKISKASPVAKENLHLIQKVDQIGPKHILSHSEIFGNSTEGKELIRIALAKEVSSGSSFEAILYFKNYKKFLSPDEEPLLKTLVKNERVRNPNGFIILNFKEFPWLKEEARELMLSNLKLLSKINKPLGEEDIKFLTDVCNEDATLREALKFLNDIDPTRFYSKNAGNYIFKSLLIHAEKPNMPKSEVEAIANDHNRFFEFAVRSFNSDSATVKRNVDELLRTESLQTVSQLNRDHERPDKVRFQWVDSLSAQEIYFLMVYGEEEVYTSSFNGLFTRFINKLNAAGESGEELLKSISNREFRTFIKITTRFNRLGEFLSTVPAESQVQLLRNFMADINVAENPLAEAVSTADVIASLEDKKILEILGETIKKEFGEASSNRDSKAMSLYGLLASIFQQETKSGDAWFAQVADRYHLPDLHTLEVSELLNNANTNVQEYFFYDDPDGRASFDSFMEGFASKTEWQVEDKGKYVHISSKVNQSAPNKIEIFANKPEYEAEGHEEISKQMAKKEVKAITIVHRGHSYHAQDTIARIPSIAKIVYLGSCGGYKNIEGVLSLAPEAHIISTKGVGTMLVNDPLLRMINSDIRAGNSIEWSKFWENAKQALGGNIDFKNYIPPHENQGARFIRAYKMLESQK